MAITEFPARFPEIGSTYSTHADILLISQDETANTSTVRIELYSLQTNSNANPKAIVKMTKGSGDVTIGAVMRTYDNRTYWYGQKTFTVTHNPVGEAEFTLTISYLQWGSSQAIETSTQVILPALDRALVRIYDGSSFGEYKPYIYKNGTWQRVVPMVFTDGSWITA